MIDAHIHVTDPELPGVKGRALALQGPLDKLADRLRLELRQAGITQGLAMGKLNGPDLDPLGINGILRLATLVPGLHAVGAIDPTRTSPEHLRRVEDVLKAGRVKAFKAYLGYLHHGPESPGYRPYYDLAAKYQRPVIFHTGDTHSTTAKLKYAHPLLVDEVAVDHPGVRFVLAHFGNPWLMEAAEVVYKNDNVWADLSGLVVGDSPGEDFNHPATRRSFEVDDVVLDVRKALRYAEKADRFLFGSDWPLAPIAPYRKLIESIIPEGWPRQAILEENARSLFDLEPRGQA